MSGEASQTLPEWASWEGRATIEDLFAQLTAHAARATGGLVWRGQSRKSWGLSSSLWRLFEPPDEVTMRSCEREQLEVVRTWRLANHALPSSSEQQVLAALQHHGAPTRLLDVTCDPFIALWFACDGAADDDGVVLCIPRSPLATLAAGDDPIGGGPATWGDVSDAFGYRYEEQLNSSLGSGLPFVVDPQNRNDRIRAQGGMFLAWAVADDGCSAYGGLSRTVVEVVEMSAKGLAQPRSVLEMSVAVVPGCLKSRVRRVLADSFGVSEAGVFPDLAGLATHLRTADIGAEPPGAQS